MGIYLNPGIKGFQMAVNSEIYVDKSEMIQYLNTVVNTQRRFVSVSRPRRFGKTMAADMICAYYDRTANSRHLFYSRKLSKCEPCISGEKELLWDEYLGKFDVIRLTMTAFFKNDISVSDALTKLQQIVFKDIKKEYPDIDYFDEKDLIQTIIDVYSTNDRQLVIVIDEWDAVFRERPNDKEGQKKYLDFLRDMLKDNNYIALAYMTGILPIKKYGKHSALNMFTEYSMMYPKQMARFTGFTEDEVQTLCNRFGRDYQAVSDWYDGYKVCDITPPDPGYEELRTTGKAPEAVRYSLYNPLSVVEAMITGEIIDYWNKTETYEALAEFIDMNYDGLKEAVVFLMDGGRLAIDTSTYQNDMTTFHGRDDVLSLLIHLGYLGYDSKKREVFIPNREILDEFKSSTKGTAWKPVFRTLQLSQKILKSTWDKDAEKVAELLEEAHNRAENKT